MSSPAQPDPADLQAEAVAREVANDMPSPYCPGRSIASCPSQAARDLEDDIVGLAKEGMDRKEIETALVSRFGEEKMGKAQQSEILVAVILGAILALVAVVYAARRWIRPAPQPVPAEGASVEKRSAPLAKVSADELDRLEDELDDLDEL
ncbi:cytochrome c-type biogenesis protein CcmH [Pseudenhygromyxa sp. WMMC2535]|uniref:cytochrome c-type biogenesis protein n=1 Tax=Pseudenhygromyxa sp. WMMC2535 TaxID=2712867 RepID=UPI0020D1BE9E|nr:cytochrome c-type biogenesis protein CcmH [Pseudenhygromyxa sp. WMMC2535]